jgi:hypothetical protein
MYNTDKQGRSVVEVKVGHDPPLPKGKNPITMYTYYSNPAHQQIAAYFFFRFDHREAN